MRWIEVAVDTQAAAEEAVANVLMEAGCGGVAIVDPSAPLFRLTPVPKPQVISDQSSVVSVEVTSDQLPVTSRGSPEPRVGSREQAEATPSPLAGEGRGEGYEAAPDQDKTSRKRGSGTIPHSTLRTAQSAIRVSAYFPLDDSFERRLDELRMKIDNLNTFFDIEGPQIALYPVDEEDWATAWRAFFKPLKIGKVVVKPSWEAYAPQEGDVVVELDPGMAFGTGSHPTTQLCLLALQKYVPEAGGVLDMGCGSGILSIAACKLGAGQVIGVDVDPVATEAAENNVRAEGLQEKVEIRLGKEPPEGQFDLVICNIIAAAIIALAERLSDALRPGGVLVSSGIILEREQEVRSKLESAGLETLEAMHDGEWTALVSRRSG